MSKLTLLDVVNTYMDLTDGYRVSSIDDVIESQQVASIAEKVFNDLSTDVFGESLSQNLVQLEASGDNLKPNYMSLPVDIKDIIEDVVYYKDSDGRYLQVQWLIPQEFLDKVNQVKLGETNTIAVTDESGVVFNIRNDKDPQFYTSFDDINIVFDSYDAARETTLQKTNTQILATRERTFTPTDAYEIDFPQWFQQGYLNSVIAEASEALREEPMPSIARKARIAIIRARKKQRIGTDGVDTKRRSYGRK